MADQDQENDNIRITHYINPHNFWFKHESAYLFNSEEQSHQLELNEFCDTTYGRGNIGGGLYTPHEEGEVVALFYFPQSRWIRAEVDEVQKDLSGNVLCNLWAIDEGIPVKSSNRYIKPLPDRFSRMSTCIKRGGLEGILPAETCYDYLQGCMVHKKVDEWSPGMARVFEGCIEEAMMISFSDMHHYVATGIDMYFGSMKITSHQNVTNNGIDLLKKAGRKMVKLVSREEFYDELPRLRVLDMRRYEDNERKENMKFHMNAFRAEFNRRPQVHPRENNMIEQAREKFLEWDMRNAASSSVNTSIVESIRTMPDPHVAKPSNYLSDQSEYTRLINESLTDEDDDDDPQIDIKLPPVKPNPPVKRADNNAPQNASPYQRPQCRVYEKSVADVTPALERIKLRRQAATVAGQKASVVGSSSGLNLMPAGFSMANVSFADGSIILGARKPNPFAKSSHKTKPNSSRKYRPKEEEDADSSFEELVKKLTITKIKSRAAEDENEKW